jgi:hypothetical protein
MTAVFQLRAIEQAFRSGEKRKAVVAVREITD